jgi:hypothetical protein
MTDPRPDKSRTMSTVAVGLGVAGLLPIPGIVASIAAVICGGHALHDDRSDGQARLAVWLGVAGIVAPLVILFVYCVVLGYPFPIHRYQPG